MRSRGISFPLLIGWCASLVLAACVTEFDLESSGTPSGTTGTPTPTPSSTITPFDPYGNGTGGNKNFDTNQVANACASVLSAPAGQGDVRLETPGLSGFFVAGRRLLLLNMQETGGATYGDATPDQPTGVGEWDLVDILGTTTTGGITRVQVGPALAHTYTTTTDGSLVAQACMVPQYDNVVVLQGGIAAASAWDGRKGGVIALSVKTELDVRGLIDASADGYRGGAPNAGPSTTTNAPAHTSTPDAAPGVQCGSKGEGADPRARARICAGNLLNAAGGGNAAAAGGGGGGGAGRGGHGGRENDLENPPAQDATRGQPGATLSAVAPFPLRFGGGGGAGHRRNFPAGRGGNGGGIIFLAARSLRVAASGGIRAAGESGGPVSAGGDSGAGGGGAGGSVILLSEGGTIAGVIDVKGGNGGKVGECTGQGGGGGGGWIIAPSSLSLVTATAGGSHGLADGLIATCTDQPTRGSDAGRSGVRMDLP